MASNTDPYRSFEALHAHLESRGYRDIPEAKGIRPGDRIRHGTHQYPRAYREGTATALAVMASGRVIGGRPDVEIIARLDRHPVAGASLFIDWADYQTERISQPDDGEVPRLDSAGSEAS